MTWYAFDIDDVLAEFEEAFCERFGYDHRERYSLIGRYPERTREIVLFVNTPQTYINLRVNYFAKQYMSGILASGDKIMLITRRPINCRNVTKDWLKENGIEHNELAFCSSKSNRAEQMLEKGVKYFIDDNAENLNEASKAGIFAIAWRHQWNKNWYPALVPMDDGLFLCESKGSFEPVFQVEPSID